MANEFTTSSFVAGTAALPSVYFGAATTSGLYQPATNQVGVSAAGTSVAIFSSATFRVSGIINAVRNATTTINCYSYQNNTIHGQFNFYSARGAELDPKVLNSGDNVGHIYARSWTTGTTFASCGLMRFVATEPHSATNLGSKFEILVTPNTTTTNTLALKVENDLGVTTYGTLKCKTGFAAFDGTPPESKAEITGDISTYNETTIKAVLTALAGYGLITDSTT